MNKVEELSERFSKLLREDLSEHVMKEVVTRNKTYGEGICASHDFCDANMVMADAFKQIVGHEIDADNEVDATLWSDAWSLAVKNEFNID